MGLWFLQLELNFWLGNCHLKTWLAKLEKLKVLRWGAIIVLWPHGKKGHSTIKPMDDEGVFSKDHKNQLFFIGWDHWKFPPTRETHTHTVNLRFGFLALNGSETCPAVSQHMRTESRMWNQEQVRIKCHSGTENTKKIYSEITLVEKNEKRTKQIRRPNRRYDCSQLSKILQHSLLSDGEKLMHSRSHISLTHISSSAWGEASA